MNPRVRWVGERAFLVEFASLDDVLAFQVRVTADPIAQTDQVAAARTVLLTFATARQARRAATRVGEVELTPIPNIDRRTEIIDVIYDGADLVEVASHTGLSEEAVVAAHTTSTWTAAFGGFAPGFAYLVGGDPRLQVSRRESPRTAVPAGSVALAGEFSAVYPRSSPGGWRLIGRTTATMWDIDRSPPALLAPGDLVRFRAVRERITAAAVAGTQVPDARAATTAGLRILAPGPMSLVEDLGRPGRAYLGVTASGAADTASARLANRLVGNARAAAVVETLGGLSVRAEIDVILALTGADARAELRRALPAESDDDGGPRDELVEPGRTLPRNRVPVRIPAGTPVLLRAGDDLALGFPDTGLRAYIAVRGGIAAPDALGSRARDTLSGIGPDPLRAGEVLEIGSSAVTYVEEPSAEAPLAGGDTAALRVRVGPRDDWFVSDEIAHFFDTVWVVSSETDRVGTRLTPADGTRPLRPRTGDLPSEGTVRGALQVPPSGEPVLFGPDHPVTGGYPVIGVVADADLPLAAQLRPGTRVRFVRS
ncbi:carboxyltransferase domain-containing protein [Microbacterium gubbeenense]|uniref:5-oxoprolinase subunit B/C family protein n=1 Tax=Microbacterium gubbeenense TaxID=159896 RepID=UPI003F9A6A78